MKVIFLVWLIVDSADYSRSGPLRFSSSRQFKSLAIAPSVLDLPVSNAEKNHEGYQYQTPNEMSNRILSEVPRASSGEDEPIFQQVERVGEFQSSPVGSRSSEIRGTGELGDTKGALAKIFINLGGGKTDVDKYLGQMRHSPNNEVRPKRTVSSTSKTRIVERTLQARALVQNRNRLTQEPLLNNKTVSVVSSVQDAVKTIESSMNRFDEIAKNLRDSKVSATTLKKAAEEGLVIQTGEGFPRQVLASATANPEAAQGALAVIRDEGPKIIAGLKEISKQTDDPSKLEEVLKIVINARTRVVLANKNLIGGIVGGDKKLISTQPFSPSLTAIGTKLSTEQRKVVDRSKKELEAKTRSINTQLSILQNKSSTPIKLKVAATSALALEAEQTFLREVLVSASSDSKAAVSALIEVAENGPKVISGLINIIRNSDDETKVKTSLQSIIESRSKVLTATTKLIHLASSVSDAEKEVKKANVTISNTPLIDPKKHDNHVEVFNEVDKNTQEESKLHIAHHHDHPILRDNNLPRPTNATSNDLRQLLSSQLTELIDNGASVKPQPSVLSIPKAA